MKTFKVRVTGAGDGDHWYSEKIGEVFSVRGSDRNMYLLTKGHKGLMKSDCVVVEDFKVGDRVRVKPECVGEYYRTKANDGGCGIITAMRDTRWFGVKLDNVKIEYEPSYRDDELILLEDTMEYTKNGVTYRQLKDITVKAFVLAGADDKYVEYFGMDYNITEQIWLRIAIDFSSRWPEKLQWLVDQGFVEVVEETLKPCPFCGGEAYWDTMPEKWVVCKICGAETRLCQSKDEAIEAWNKRV